MQANLQRLGDLTAEIRRQLTPLGKQAEVARRAQTVQFDVRDAKSRLLADDLVRHTRALEKDVADEAALKERREVVEAELAAGRQRQIRLEQLAAEATPRLNAARDDWYQLSATRDRLRALGSLATERRRLLGASDAAPDSGRDPDHLDRQAARVRQEQSELEHDILAKQAGLLEATAAKQDAENLAAAEDKRLTAVLRAAADRREGLAKLVGQLAAARSRAEAAEAERAGSGNRWQPVRNVVATRKANLRPSSRKWPASKTAKKASTPNTKTPAPFLTRSTPRLRR